MTCVHFDVVSSHIMKIYIDPMAAFKNHASDSWHNSDCTFHPILAVGNNFVFLSVFENANVVI